MTTASLSIEQISNLLTTIITNQATHGLFGIELQAIKEAEQIVRNCYDLTGDPDATTLQLCNEIERRAAP